MGLKRILQSRSKLGIVVKSRNYVGNTMLKPEIEAIYDFMPKFVAEISKHNIDYSIDIENVSSIIQDLNNGGDCLNVLLKKVKEFSSLLDDVERIRNFNKNYAFVRETIEYKRMKALYENCEFTGKVKRQYQSILNHIFVSKHIKKDNFNTHNSFSKIFYNISSFIVNLFRLQKKWKFEYTDDRMVKISDSIISFLDSIYHNIKHVNKLDIGNKKGLTDFFIEEAKKQAKISSKNIISEERWFDTLGQTILKCISTIKNVFSIADFAKITRKVISFITKPRECIHQILHNAYNIKEMNVKKMNKKEKTLVALRVGGSILDAFCNITDFANEFNDCVDNSSGFLLSRNVLWTTAFITNNTFAIKDGKFTPKIIEKFINDNFEFHDKANNKEELAKILSDEFSGNKLTLDVMDTMVSRDVNKGILEFQFDDDYIEAFKELKLASDKNVRDKLIKQMENNLDMFAEDNVDSIKKVQIYNYEKLKCFLLKQNIKNYDDVKNLVKTETFNIEFGKFIKECEERYKKIYNTEVFRDEIAAYYLENYNYKICLNDLGILLKVKKFLSPTLVEYELDILSGKYNDLVKKEMGTLPINKYVDNEGNDDWLFSQYFKMHMEKAFYKIATLYINNELNDYYIKIFIEAVRQENFNPDNVYKKIFKEVLEHNKYKEEKEFVFDVFLPAITYASICYNGQYQPDNMMFKNVRDNCYKLYKMENSKYPVQARIYEMANMSSVIKKLENASRKYLEEGIFKKYYSDNNRISILKNFRYYNGFIKKEKENYIKERECKLDIGTASRIRAWFKIIVLIIIACCVFVGSISFLLHSLSKHFVNTIGKFIAESIAKKVAKCFLLAGGAAGLIINVASLINYGLHGGRKYMIKEEAREKFGLVKKKYKKEIRLYHDNASSNIEKYKVYFNDNKENSSIQNRSVKLCSKSISLFDKKFIKRLNTK